jgi:hypothetical protein
MLLIFPNCQWRGKRFNIIVKCLASDPAVQSTLRWSGLEVAGSNQARSREKLAEIKIPPLMHDDFQFLELLVFLILKLLEDIFFEKMKKKKKKSNPMDPRRYRSEYF